jgi:hypothetical protein
MRVCASDREVSASSEKVNALEEYAIPNNAKDVRALPEELKRLRDTVRRKRPELWQSGEWLLHQDNAPAHTALSVRQFLK